jgi:glycosyltransferase involved in cell wall biosynthesis
MKIVQIVTQMEAAGAQRVAYLLHGAFGRRGYETELWFLYLKRPAYSGKPGVRVLSNRRPSLLGYFLLAIKLFAWIRTHKPDVIITHTHYANILGQLAGTMAGVRCRLAVHQNDLKSYPPLCRCADWLLAMLGIYTTAIAVSKSVLESMPAYPARYKRNVRVIYNVSAVDQNTCLNGRQLVNLPVNCQKLLHVGRLSRQKNHLALFKTLQQLPGKYLVLVGDGELRDKLELQVKVMGLADRVRFLGEIAPEEVRAVMRVCDLFMFPSAYEGMPMALFEAMAAGMPIIASDIAANQELLQDSGILLPPDPEQFAGAAARLLADRGAAARLGERAARRAKEFTVDAMADGYESLFSS